MSRPKFAFFSDADTNRAPNVTNPSEDINQITTEKVKENTGANYDVFQVECEDLDGDDLKFKVEWETNHGNDVFTFDTDSRSHLFAWILCVPVNHLSFMSGRVFPQGGTLIFSYIRRLGSFFGVQKFEFQYFWGF